MSANHYQKQLLVLAVAAAQTSVFALLPAQATEVQGGVQKSTGKTGAVKSYFQKHDKVRSATIGAGVGMGAGALTGLVTHHGVVRGAAIGAGTGAGVGLISSSKTLKSHPIMRDVATAATAGVGLGWAGSTGHNRTKRIAQTGAVGAALGLGYGLLKDKLK
jgi:hypothetical protein